MKSDTVDKLLSKMEARIFRSLNKMLQMSVGPEYQLRLFSNFPLSQLVRKWPKYVNDIDGVIGLTEEDYISSPRIIWPSNHYPMFEWDNADGKETAVPDWGAIHKRPSNSRDAEKQRNQGLDEQSKGKRPCRTTVP